MGAEPDYKPFEKVLEDDRTILRLRGTEEQRVKVEADKVHLIMDAIVEGWGIDVKYADIDGEINIDREINKGKIIDPNFTIKDGVTIESCDIKGRVILKRCTFSQEANFSWTHFEKRADFEKAVFKARANFYGATFQDAYFRYTRFKKEVLFHEATFAKANFEESQFGTELSTESSMDADFIRAKFTGDMNFWRARFRHKAAFICVYFENADFDGAIFETDAEFRESEFNKKANFWRAKFEYPASFNGVKFRENTLFKGLWNDAILSIFWLAVRYIPPFSIIVAMLERMKRKFLFSTEFTPQYNTDNSILDKARREIMNREYRNRGLSTPTSTSTKRKGKKWFMDVNDGRKYIIIKRKSKIDFYREREDVSQLVNFVYNIWEKVRACRIQVTDFSRFNTTTVVDAATNPYLKRYIDDENWLRSWRERGWLRKLMFFLWEATSHCGRSIGLWAFWSALIAMLFGVLYAQYPFPSWLSWVPGLKRLLTSVSHPELYITPRELNAAGELIRETTGFTPYYFSIVTFTTLGFGDVTPLNLAGEVWLAIEVVLGYVMLGGLISIFANKLARRS